MGSFAACQVVLYCIDKLCCAVLFLLRHVDPQELIRQAGSGPAADASAASDAAAAGLADADLSALFGIEIDAPPPPAKPPRRTRAKG